MTPPEKVSKLQDLLRQRETELDRARQEFLHNKDHLAPQTISEIAASLEALLTHVKILHVFLRVNEALVQLASQFESEETEENIRQQEAVVIQRLEEWNEMWRQEADRQE